MFQTSLINQCSFYSGSKFDWIISSKSHIYTIQLQESSICLQTTLPSKYLNLKYINRTIWIQVSNFKFFHFFFPFPHTKKNGHKTSTFFDCILYWFPSQFWPRELNFREMFYKENYNRIVSLFYISMYVFIRYTRS